MRKSTVWKIKCAPLTSNSTSIRSKLRTLNLPMTYLRKTSWWPRIAVDHLKSHLKNWKIRYKRTRESSKHSLSPRVTLMQRSLHCRRKRVKLIKIFQNRGKKWKTCSLSCRTWTKRVMAFIRGWQRPLLRSLFSRKPPSHRKRCSRRGTKRSIVSTKRTPSTRLNSITSGSNSETWAI